MSESSQPQQPAQPPPQPPRRNGSGLFWLLMALVVGVVLVVVATVDTDRRPFGLDPSDFASVGYLAVILIFVGSALLGRGLGAGEVVRAVAGWLGIFLILIGAYAYREELTGVGTRLLGVLAPGVPIAGRLAGEDAGTVVIERANDGHFGARAEINGVGLFMMVDTGASFVTLTMRDAASVGIDVDTLRFNAPIRTANGLIHAAPVTLRHLALGTIERSGVQALVAPPNSLDESLLGMSFLNSLQGYAISGNRLVLTP